MKTIRSNCFETNSSSTHSITIVSKRDLVRKDVPLVVDGVLHPRLLIETSAYVSKDTYYGDSRTLTASTRDQKAALFVHHLKSLSEDTYDWEEQNQKISFEVFFEQCITFLKGSIGYADINTSFDCNFRHYTEYGDSYVLKLGNLTDVENHIREVILNDDAVIIDEFEEN